MYGIQTWVAMSKPKDMFEAGDNCYILVQNKIKFCEVLKVLQVQDDGRIGYEVRDLIDYRHMAIEHKFCADDEKTLKALLKETRELAKAAKASKKS